MALANASLTDEGVRGLAEVSLIFLDESTIAALNQQFMGKSGPTDVLSFPIDNEPEPSGRVPDAGGSGPGEPPLPEIPQLIGDIVICPAVAAINAVEHEVLPRRRARAPRRARCVAPARLGPRGG